MHKYQSIQISTGDTDIEIIVVHLWHEINQFNTLCNAYGFDTPAVPDKFTSFIYNKDAGVVFIQCGYDEIFPNRFEIIEAFGEFKNLNQFRLGYAIKQIEDFMNSYASQFLTYEAEDRLKLLHGIDAVKSGDVFNYAIIKDLSSIRTKLWELT